MWPDRVSNPGPPTYESGALPTAQRSPASYVRQSFACNPFLIAYISVTTYQILFVSGSQYVCSNVFSISYVSTWARPQGGARGQ